MTDLETKARMAWHKLPTVIPVGSFDKYLLGFIAGYQARVDEVSPVPRSLMPIRYPPA